MIRLSRRPTDSSKYIYSVHIVHNGHGIEIKRNCGEEMKKKWSVIEGAYNRWNKSFNTLTAELRAGERSRKYISMPNVLCAMNDRCMENQSTPTRLA